jgi:F-type H+-transporting ATPase subunit b
MEFDATFLIAVISFIVFVLLMNKIFYAPVLKIMQARQSFVEKNYSCAAETKKQTEERTQYRENELEKSRKSSREMIAQHSQNLKNERNKELAEYKENINFDIVRQKDGLKNSAIEAKDVLKDNVVDIAKDISQILLGESINKENINKSQIEE